MWRVVGDDNVRAVPGPLKLGFDERPIRGVSCGSIRRLEGAAQAGLSYLNAAVVGELAAAGRHRRSRIAVEAVVRPQGRADEADAGQRDGIAIEQVDAGAVASRPAGREAFVEAAAVVLVIAGHVDDRPSGEAGRLGEAPDRALGRCVDVAGEHRHVKRRERLGQRPRRAML